MSIPPVVRVLPVALAVALAVSMGGSARSQQEGDPGFRFDIPAPAWPEGEGPLVVIDAGHNNFHTVDGRYRPFAELLRRDGYRVEGRDSAFAAEMLADIDVLVIANPLGDDTVDDWVLPSDPAFTRKEVKAVRKWVKAGGALFLIIDHMPIPGDAKPMTSGVGAKFTNGYVMLPGPSAPMVFERDAGLTGGHPITEGQTAAERVGTVATFTGSAFKGSRRVFEPILTVPEGAVSLETYRAGQFQDETPRRDVGGWWQGAVRGLDDGRVAVFGEAAMFTAQLAGPEKRPIGMNAEIAKDNPQLLLNIMHWLSGPADGAEGAPAVD